jgi:pimeloyl-ACP methyl ester carboxylesterase
LNTARFSVAIAAAIMAMIWLGGCNGLITGVMVHAPNHGKNFSGYELPDARKLDRLGVDAELRVPAGPPAADLRVWVMHPRGEEDARLDTPRGTVLVLHGYRNRAEWMRDTARDFAEAGYRSVIVEMRGHGSSSGDFITFAACEAHDVRQVIDQLDRLDLIEGDLGVWGISMGAATAIKLAAIDSRVRTVVAVAPYTHMRDVVPGFVRLFMPVYGWVLSDAKIQELVDEATAEAGFSPADTDILAAMEQVQAPVLILHGTWDILVPPDMGEQLMAAAPPGSELRRLGATGHVGAMFSDVPERESIEWFNAHLGAAPLATP